jgi:hypothetical protein
MKATRTNFDDMWDKYFDNYQGWLYVADCLFPSREQQKPSINTIAKEECTTSYILSDSEDNSSDKFYSFVSSNRGQFIYFSNSKNIPVF